MSRAEWKRAAVLTQVKSGRLTLKSAADRLGVSCRQAKRQWRRWREVGDAGLVHGLRERPSNNRRRADAQRERALALYRERYAGMGPTLAAQMLAKRDGLAVDHETLRGWLVGEGLWRVRRDRSRRHRRWRPRQACFGELVQFDGSQHAWFGEDRPKATLMVMVDGHRAALRQQSAGHPRMGRVEPNHDVLHFQGRLVKMMKLDAITDIEAANAYLHEVYLPDHNARFACAPQGDADAHHPPPPHDELDAA